MGALLRPCVVFDHFPTSIPRVRTTNRQISASSFRKKIFQQSRNIFLTLRGRNLLLGRQNKLNSIFLIKTNNRHGWISLPCAPTVVPWLTRNVLVTHSVQGFEEIQLIAPRVMRPTTHWKLNKVGVAGSDRIPLESVIWCRRRLANAMIFNELCMCV